MKLLFQFISEFTVTFGTKKQVMYSYLLYTHSTLYSKSCCRCFTCIIQLKIKFFLNVATCLITLDQQDENCQMVSDFKEKNVNRHIAIFKEKMVKMTINHQT